MTAPRLSFRGHLLRTLGGRGYSVQEMLVSPTQVSRRLGSNIVLPGPVLMGPFLSFNQFGIPNSRLRYYLLARLAGQKVRLLRLLSPRMTVAAPT